MMITSCLFPGTHYVIVYFSGSTSLCLGPEIKIYNKNCTVTLTLISEI